MKRKQNHSRNIAKPTKNGMKIEFRSVKAPDCSTDKTLHAFNKRGGWVVTAQGLVCKSCGVFEPFSLPYAPSTKEVGL